MVHQIHLVSCAQWHILRRLFRHLFVWSGLLNVHTLPTACFSDLSGTCFSDFPSTRFSSICNDFLFWFYKDGLSTFSKFCSASDVFLLRLSLCLGAPLCSVQTVFFAEESYVFERPVSVSSSSAVACFLACCAEAFCGKRLSLNFHLIVLTKSLGLFQGEKVGKTRVEDKRSILRTGIKVYCDEDLYLFKYYGKKPKSY